MSMEIGRFIGTNIYIQVLSTLISWHTYKLHRQVPRALRIILYIFHIYITKIFTERQMNVKNHTRIMYEKKFSVFGGTFLSKHGKTTEHLHSQLH